MILTAANGANCQSIDVDTRIKWGTEITRPVLAAGRSDSGCLPDWSNDPESRIVRHDQRHDSGAAASLSPNGTTTDPS